MQREVIYLDDVAILQDRLSFGTIRREIRHRTSAIFFFFFFRIQVYFKFSPWIQG
jgi:hypothetical protein